MRQQYTQMNLVAMDDEVVAVQIKRVFIEQSSYNANVFGKFWLLFLNNFEKTITR